MTRRSAPPRYHLLHRKTGVALAVWSEPHPLETRPSLHDAHEHAVKLMSIAGNGFTAGSIYDWRLVINGVCLDAWSEVAP